MNINNNKYNIMDIVITVNGENKSLPDLMKVLEIFMDEDTIHKQIDVTSYYLEGQLLDGTCISLHYSEEE